MCVVERAGVRETQRDDMTFLLSACLLVRHFLPGCRLLAGLLLTLQPSSSTAVPSYAHRTRAYACIPSLHTAVDWGNSRRMCAQRGCTAVLLSENETEQACRTYAFGAQPEPYYTEHEQVASQQRSLAYGIRHAPVAGAVCSILEGAWFDRERERVQKTGTNTHQGLPNTHHYA